MNPLTDMRKNKSPPKKNCIHVDTFINDLWKGRKIRLKTIIPIISWTTRLQQYTQIAYSSGFINAELWKDNPLKVCILYFISIRIIPYENKKIHNDRVEDILCFRLCQIPTKYRTLHSNDFKLHNFVRLLLFFLQICLKIKFYYETTIRHVISINHLSLYILWTSLIWIFFSDFPSQPCIPPSMHKHQFLQ